MINFAAVTTAAPAVSPTALQRKGMTKKIFKQILKNQTKDKTRRAKSNYIINTSDSKKKTYLQINNIIYDILKKNK